MIGQVHTLARKVYFTYFFVMILIDKNGDACEVDNFIKASVTVNSNE